VPIKIKKSKNKENKKLKIRVKDFQVRGKGSFDLSSFPTRVEPLYDSKKTYRGILQGHVTELSRLQSMLYASGNYAILILFQAMDTGGKDGMIRHVMSGINPQGCKVIRFRQPSEKESRHDFLWRITKELPERGQICIFNRSYYEDVLVTRVHPELLRAQKLPAPYNEGDPLWEGRYRSICDLEAHLHRNGTRILKFFLHISEEEQRQRLIERINDVDKNWKFSISDINERNYWSGYMRAYEHCIKETSTRDAPWYVIPADDKENARIIVSHIILRALRKLELSMPTIDAQQRKNLLTIREKLQFIP
jgi:PPK2 family polyphosphate:nucleotide phosphotransferase